MKTSKLFTLSLRDAFKGLIMAVLTVIVTSLLTILNNGGLPTLNDLKAIGITSLIAGSTYLLKNFLTSSEDKILAKEPDNILPR